MKKVKYGTYEFGGDKMHATLGEKDKEALFHGWGTMEGTTHAIVEKADGTVLLLEVEQISFGYGTWIKQIIGI